MTKPQKTRFFLALPLLFLSALPAAGAEARAEALSPTEYELKAAFIYNFTKFITWPAGSFESDESPINVCLLGSDPFGGAIDALKDKSSRGKPFTVNRIATAGQERILSLPCHVLFISPSEESRLPKLLKLLGRAPLLTVSDMAGFSQSGGLIGFKMKGNRIAFTINNDKAKASNLKISSELLKLAEVVGN